jgi:hypothetical protein
MSYTKVTGGFSTETLQTRPEQDDMFKVLKREKIPANQEYHTQECKRNNLSKM